MSAPISADLLLTIHVSGGSARAAQQGSAMLNLVKQYFIRTAILWVSGVLSVTLHGDFDFIEGHW